MVQAIVAAEHFGLINPVLELLTDGLIHKTYKASAHNQSIILQQVNTSVFTTLENVVSNYEVIFHHVRKNSSLKIPSLLKTVSGQFVWTSTNGTCWRAFEFVEDSYTEELPLTHDKIYSAALCYGRFTKALAGLAHEKLIPTIVGFHDLRHRYHQFKEAKKSSDDTRLKKSADLIRKTEAHENLVGFYDRLLLDSGFKIRPMHHDSKLSNILFDKKNRQAICPIDLDTTMPGYYFSDLGDMIRSMASSAAESSSEEISIHGNFYQAVLDGYRSGIGDALTKAENAALHHAGPLMIYMQAIRFLTDYLNRDIYYKTTYPDQNFDRARNQFLLLEKLENFLMTEYRYSLK